MWLSERKGIIFSLVLAFLVLASSLSFIGFSTSLSKGYMTAADCTVSNKYHNSDWGNGNSAYPYRLELLLDAKTGVKKSVAVSEQSYENVEIGDVLPCTIVHNAKNVIELYVLDAAVDQYTELERRGDWYIRISAVLCGCAAIGGAVMLVSYLKKRRAWGL